MSSHDRLRIGLAKTCQNWRAFAHVMQVHENYYIKRAGVAGIRARVANHVDAVIICSKFSKC
ncbi:hypothetical protein FC541_24155 [Escherichia coli]|nr:hypothetical protein [Escherichia coli]MJJ02722.1 hypothetical protein [Escherichia coli]MLI07100.1 hypothetical protein [Escherichia coli]